MLILANSYYQFSAIIKLMHTPCSHPLASYHSPQQSRNSRLYQQLLQNDYLNDNIFNHDTNNHITPIRFLTSSPSLQSEYQHTPHNPFKTFDLSNKSSIQATQSLSSNFCITQTENQENSTVNLYSLSGGQVQPDLQLSSNNITTKLDDDIVPPSPMFTQNNPGSAQNEFIRKYKSQSYAKSRNDLSLNEDRKIPPLIEPVPLPHFQHSPKYGNARQMVKDANSNFKTVLSQIHVVPYFVNQEMSSYGYPAQNMGNSNNNVNMNVNMQRRNQGNPGTSRSNILVDNGTPRHSNHINIGIARQNDQNNTINTVFHVPQATVNTPRQQININNHIQAQHATIIPQQINQMPLVNTPAHIKHYNTPPTAEHSRSHKRSQSNTLIPHQNSQINYSQVVVQHTFPRQLQHTTRTAYMTSQATAPPSLNHSEIQPHIPRPAPKSQPKYHNTSTHSEKPQRFSSIQQKKRKLSTHKQARLVGWRPKQQSKTQQTKQMMQQSKRAQQFTAGQREINQLQSQQSSILFQNSISNVCCTLLKSAQKQQPNKINFKPRPHAKKGDSMLPQPMHSLDFCQNQRRPIGTSYKISSIKKIKESSESDRQSKKGLRLVGFPFPNKRQ